jgi:glycosyltransferase involved in cell wall biosynthesis
MTAPQISVVIPMYNAGRHLRASLDSVAGQTYGGFECLCVDDGSSDGSADAAGAYAARDARFKVLRQANAGCSAARNRGIQSSSAPHLFFLDADDVLHPQAFEILLGLIESHEADAASCQYSRVPDGFALADPARYAAADVKAEVDTSPFLSFFSKGKRESAAVWTRLYRRSAVGDIRFPEGVHFAEDLVYVAKVMHRIKRLAATQVPLLFYRDNPASATNLEVSERKVRSFALAAQALHDYFRCQALSASESRRVAAAVATMAYKTCVVPFVRDARLQADAGLLALSLESWQSLVESGAVEPACLTLRKRLIARCFAGGRLALGRCLDALVSRRGR